MEPTFDIMRFVPLLIPVIILQLGLMVFALVDLMRRENVNYLPKYGWALVIIFVNMIGPIIYLLMGRSEE